jgi:sugar lactone lactonase YvrE
MSNCSKYFLFLWGLFAGFINPCALQAQIISTVAGGGPGGLRDGGAATSATLNTPTTIAVDAAGNIYIADLGNSRVRKVNTLGIISTVAGGGTGGDGGLAVAARLHQPNGVAVDGGGNLYIAEIASGGGDKIRKVNTSGIISTVAGNGTPGYTGDGGPATNAQLDQAAGVAIDPAGNIYIADWGNNRIRKVDASGYISTIAGGGSSLGDGGPAVAAILTNPYSVSLDISGNLYIADEHGYRLRKVDLSGIITTVAGNGIAGSIGDGGPAISAEFDQPDGIVANAGSLYIADASNNRVRTVDLTSGIVNNAAGTGTPGFTDGVIATAAMLNTPSGVALDVQGNIYIADFANNRIRKISINNHIPTFTGGHMQTLSICEDTVAVSVNSLLAVQDTDTGQTETWVLFKSPAHGTASVTYTTTSTGGVLNPSGLTYTPATGFFGNDTFQVKADDRISIDSTTIVVTVLPLPNPDPVSGSTDLCIGSTILLTDDTTGGTWTTASGNATVSGGLVTGIHGGTDTVIYTVTNSCGLTRVSKTITIDSTAYAGLITGGSSICIGSKILLSDATGGGMWGCTNTTASVYAGIISGLSAGVDTVTYSLTNACGTVSALHIVSMTTTLPYAGPITGLTNAVCEGGTITLTETTTGGAWGSTNSHAYVGGGVVSALTGGRDTITYSVTNGCGTATARYPIIINAFPNPGNILGTDHTCPGYTVTLADYSAGGTWTSSNSSVATISAAGLVLGVSSGSSLISYTLSNACGTSRVFFAFTVLLHSDCGAAGVHNTGENPALKIYPNPNNGAFTLELGDHDGNAVVTISDLFGKTMETRACREQKNSFTIGNKLPGTYIIKVQTTDAIYTEKVSIW